MKIGILTMYRSGNYGATLQAYATKQAINENNFGEAEIINYCSDAVKQKIDRRFIKKAGLFGTAVACVEKIYYHPRMKKVNAFIDSYAPAGQLKKEELAALSDRYDIFLSGSDQIWNPQIQQGDYSYLLDFVDDPKKKRSYGSSFGVRTIDEEYVKQYKKLLSEYHRITVREEAGAELIRDLLGIDVDLVIDPALLLTPEQWISKLPERKFKGDYVFSYQMAHSPLIGKIVGKAAKEKKLKAIFVPFPIMGFCKCRPVLNLSSMEWLRAIYDSKFVVTDSFHGAVFSIIFRKPFYYVITSNTIRKRLSRLETLLGSLGIENRLVDDVSKCDFTKEIDYDAVHKKLKEQRDRSLRILKELINDEN